MDGVDYTNLKSCNSHFSFFFFFFFLKKKIIVSFPKRQMLIYRMLDVSDRKYGKPTAQKGLQTTMAQMAPFSFPYYFTISNSEFRIPNAEIRRTNWTLAFTIYFNSANFE